MYQSFSLFTLKAFMNGKGDMVLELAKNNLR
jgi:hypothetical protein